MAEPKKVYYSIGEVSEMLDITLPTLRYWETQIDQLQPKTNSHKTRFYTADDVELVKRIKYLREEQHLSIAAIKRMLNADSKTNDREMKIAQYLKSIRAELVELRSLM